MFILCIIGCLSLFCLSISLVIPQWITTTEVLPPPLLQKSPVLALSLHVHIGLFSVCPQLINITFNPMDKDPYKTPSIPSFKCSAISFKNISSIPHQNDLLLWAPVKKTQSLIYVIR